jgi:uncharacterized protein
MPTSMADIGPVLLAHARAAIDTEMGTCIPNPPDHPGLYALGASFVTLVHNHQLRGCIGHLSAIQPLGIDVRENARAAAFHDPRFPPLTTAEWPDTYLKISVLDVPTYSHCPTEEDCLRQIRPFEDGVIIESGTRRATFLPQVWQELPEPQEFIAHLLRKAGLPVGVWPSDMQLGRYQVHLYQEAD